MKNKELRYSLFFLLNIKNYKKESRNWLLKSFAPIMVLLVVVLLVAFLVKKPDSESLQMYSWLFLTPIYLIAFRFNKIAKEISDKTLALKISLGLKYSEYFAAKTIVHVLWSSTFSFMFLIPLLVWDPSNVALWIVVWIAANVINFLFFQIAINLSGLLRTKAAANIPVIIASIVFVANTMTKTYFTLGVIPVGISNASLFEIVIPLLLGVIGLGLSLNFFINPRLTFVRWDNRKSQAQAMN